MAPRNITGGKKITASTSKGAVEGLTCYYGYKKRQDKYYAFLRVPYAQIPVGHLRFADPQDIETYFDARNVLELNAENLFENCLHVHIFTPAVRPRTSEEHYTRPVIVFVPSFRSYFDEGVYGGEFLCAEDVVVVMLFFRSNILGFTGFPESNGEQLGVSGEAGLRDIIKGFEFVKSEIRHFGGCPDNITAYAHGPSCAYIRRLALQPYSGKYFHKMILSGSLEHSMRSISQLRQHDIRQVAEALGPDERFEDDRACLEFLRQLPVDKLVKCSDPIYMNSENDVIVRKNNLLSVRADIYGAQMPVLIGFNSMEAFGQRFWTYRPLLKAGNLEGYLKYLLRLTQTSWSTEAKAAKAAGKIIEVYRENLETVGCTQDIYYHMIETDIRFLVGIINLATNLAKEMHPENVYLYQFSVDFSKYSKWNQLDDKFYPGAGHTDEFNYIFNSMKHESDIKKDRKKYAVIKQMSGIWAQFAKTGNPNPKGLVNMWRPIGERLTHYYEIRSDCSIYREFTPLEKIRFQLWEKIYGIDFFSAQIRKPEPINDPRSENNKTKSTPSGALRRSVIQTCTILPKEKPHDQVTAYTSKGSIQGDVYFYNKFYNSFQHVPYAQVPVVNLRFAAPKEIDSFKDVKTLKLNVNGRYGLEDNLFLHIYTPEVRPKTSDKHYTRPVIVFVPGRLSAKAEQYRSEDLYGPQYLMEEDVVLVVLSYRRGILGFTSFEEPNAELDVPIDAGVQDIMQGFRFVKNEIRNFGGSPDNVTAYGQGTGATWVRRIAAKHAKDELFHKMILSSSMEHATGIELPMKRYDVRSLVEAKMEDFTELSTEDKDCIDFLRNMPIEELLLCDAPMFERPTKYRVFREKHLLSLSTQSYETKMPVLMGYNSTEGLMEQLIASDNGHDDVSESDWTEAVDQLSDDLRHKNEIATTVDDHYVEKTKVKKPNRETMFSDSCYIIGTIALASHFARAMAPANVYLYRFGVDLDCNFTKKLYGCKMFNEAAHADELGYIFKTPVTQFVEKDSYNEMAVKRMTKLWAQFARTGNPNPPKRSELLDEVWRPVARKLTKCFHIDTRHVTYDKIPETEMSRFAYWEAKTELKFFSGSLFIAKP